MVNRKILHLDLDAFFCSVEELNTPDLIGKAFAVGGEPSKRGVIASCSYAARLFGIHAAMPTSTAIRLCPSLILISGKHSLYHEYSNKVINILHTVTPLVEQISIDEAFLDVSDMLESGELLAHMLQKRILQEARLPCSIGVAGSKLVAKIANDYGKSQNKSNLPPKAITVVKPGEEMHFLSSLPVQSLWGIGEKTANRLQTVGIKTIGDLRELNIDALKKYFGKSSYEIFNRARGIDNSAVAEDNIIKSVSNEITLSHNTEDYEEMSSILLSLTEKVAQRLRKANLAGNTIHIKIRYADFSTITRQNRINQFTDQAKIIYPVVKLLFRKNFLANKAVRLLGVGVSGLCPPARQLSLWNQSDIREIQLSKVVDELKEKYGSDIIYKAHVKNKN